MSQITVPWTKQPRRGVEKLFEEVDAWIGVEYRTTGVTGLVVTPRLKDEEPVEGEWVLTHRGTGRTVGQFVFPSIAAATRAARSVSDLIDWSDDELLYDLLKPSMQDRLREVSAHLRKEAL